MRQFLFGRIDRPESIRQTSMHTIITLAASGTGLWAAWLWYLSSKVEIVPTWVKCGRIEPPGDPVGSSTGWTAGILEASSKAAGYNKQAALWTAGSVLLGVVGSWIH